MQKTESTSGKVRKWNFINAKKKIYTVSSSLRCKKNYLVTICNVPSWFCPDFRKRVSKVLCKHIIFAFLYIVQLKDEHLLLSTQIGYDDLKGTVMQIEENFHK